MNKDTYTIDLKQEEKFAYFINERHHIYLKRSAGEPFPWTLDPIMQKFKFTNVFRELDRGTVFCREHIREPYAQHCELFFNIAIYRRYNHYPTFESVGYVFNYEGLAKDQIIANIRGRIRDHKAVYTSAHMLCGMISDDNGIPIPDRTSQIWDYAFGKLWEKRKELEPVSGDCLESAFFKCLNARIPAFGPFIWYEVITDLRHTRYLNNASDIMTWANPGPGAARGLARICNVFQKGKPVPIPRSQQLDLMRKLLWNSMNWRANYVPSLEMRDIEHSLCEWDKYERVMAGEGHTRQVFIPPELRKQV